MKKIIISIVASFTFIYANSITAIIDSSKIAHTTKRLDNLYRITKLSNLTKEVLSTDKIKNIEHILSLAVKENKISFTDQWKYMREFKTLENGDKILLKCINTPECKLDNTLDIAKKSSLNLAKAKNRRITNLEKQLLTSKRAKKIKFEGRTVITRRVYNCSQSNIALMLKGQAPFGFDGKKVNLHHLKQQQFGALVVLSATEHNTHSKVLHRYTKTSEILDRNSEYSKFRQKWWKSRATNCMSRGM